MTTHHDPRNCDCTLHTATPQVCPDPLDEEALFWHERWHEAANQRDARDAAAYAWKEAARRLSIRARARWSFCDFLLSERTRADNAMIRMSARLSEAEKRAAKAEQERSSAWEQLEHRDHELATAEAHRDEAQRLAAEQIAEAQSEATEAVTRAEQERDEARKWARKAEFEAITARSDRDAAEEERDEMRESLHLMADSVKVCAEQPRPLITDEMVVRAVAAYNASMAGTRAGHMREVLTAALTPPPKRPEGAEEIEAILIELPDTMLPITDAGRADLLASRGVRAPGGEETR